MDIRYIPVLLHERRMRDVSEPVDHVWALVGLFDDELRSKVIPFIDYGEEARKEYWKIYLKVAKEILLLDPSLGILSISPSLEKDPGPTTWCPNFSGWPTTGLLYTFLEGFRAGISGFRNSQHPAPQVSFYEYDDFLRILGFRIDIVPEVVDDPRLHGRIGSILEERATYEWESSCLELARRVKVDGGIPSAYGRTLTSGGGKADPEAWEQAYQHAFQDAPHLTHRSLGPNNRAVMKARFKGRFIKFLGRSFFSTQSGLLGSGLAGLQSGDTICTFHGPGPLFVLRFAAQDGTVASFIGDAYIHDYTDLDNLSGWKRMASETFAIR
jgi:hypothetical protein